jgi:hypothetical protein
MRYPTPLEAAEAEMEMFYARGQGDPEAYAAAVDRAVKVGYDFHRIRGHHRAFYDRGNGTNSTVLTPAEPIPFTLSDRPSSVPAGGIQLRFIL